VVALFSAELEKLKKSGEAMPEDLERSIERTRADYDRWLDARYAAARGHVDAVIDPKDTREILSQALELTMTRPRAEALVLETLG
jgi:acetyl-CoA carboxylase carboxyltransferase component